ncbi:amidase [Ceratobasidium sp. AG-Ba]|nr:amidase [Ceratobasidium sp. AG-Ba]
MANFYAALCIIQALFGLGSRRDNSPNTTDWLKLALVVAAQPEDEESKRLIQVALDSNNQEFLDYLRAALNTRIAAAARLADIESDGIECRAFLPGSPALWGWTTNMVAESAILKTGIEAAMSASVFDSPSASCSSSSEDVFVGLNSSEVMGGATLRDIYAKAWEFHREPLIWTPRGPGAGVGASTWTLTPASLTSQGAKKRNRSVSDASESRYSIIGQSPCLQGQRNRTRRDSLHDVFAPSDIKNGSKTSPCIEAEVAAPSPSVVTPPLASADCETTFRRPRRSDSSARSHISSTTAITVSECSTTQELIGLELGRSLDRSVWSRSDTPTDSCFGDCEPGNEMDAKGKRTYSVQGRGLASSAVAFRRNKVSSHSAFTNNSKQYKLSRPNITPLQRSQAAIPKHLSDLQQSSAVSSAKNPREKGGRSSRFNSVVSAGQIQSARSQEQISLRRVRSVAVMPLSPSPSPRAPKAALPKSPLVGPVPAARRASIKQDSRLTESSKLVQNTSLDVSDPAVTPVAPRLMTSRSRVPSMTQSQIPRPASRATSVSEAARAGSPLPSTPRVAKRELQQLPTPTSIVRAGSQASRPGSSAAMYPRSRAGSSTQEPPALGKDIRLSRPSSRARLVGGPSDVLKHRTKRSDSIASVSTMADRREPVIDKCALVAA